MDIAKMTSLTRDTYTKEILNRKRESQENTAPPKKKTLLSETTADTKVL